MGSLHDDLIFYVENLLEIATLTLICTFPGVLKIFVDESEIHKFFCLEDFFSWTDFPIYNKSNNVLSILQLQLECCFRKKRLHVLPLTRKMAHEDKNILSSKGMYSICILGVIFKPRVQIFEDF